MSDAWPPTGRLIWSQAVNQWRVFARTPIAAFFTILLPLIMLVLLVAVFGNDEVADGVSAAQFYAPSLAVFAAASATYTNLGIGVSLQRDQGILKRVRGTPLPPWTFMTGVVLSAVWLALIGVVLMTGVGLVAYDLQLEPAKLPGAVLSFVVGVATFAALGLALAAVTPNAEAAPAIANATILPIAFVSDIFLSSEDAPTWLQVVGGIFPLKHFSLAFGAAFDPATEPPAIEWGHLAVLAVWGAIGAGVALRFFRWEPRPGSTGGRRRRRGARVETGANA